MRRCVKCGASYGGAEQFCPLDGSRLEGTAEIEELPLELVSEEQEPDPYEGKVIQGRYRVISRLGEGGMGVVYVAEHVEIEKRVAVKVLRDDFSKRPEVVQRFRQEARSASKIGHPNIVDVTDFGQLDDGGVFFVMECLEGRGLNEISRSQPLPLTRAVPIVEQIARALQAAHEKGIVHRDLKPENVFLIEREGNPDFVKILDFGIAKISDRDSEGKRLTKTGMIFGTPEYMSPEQAAGKPLDHRVDIYSLGCMMYEMFTGNVPYDGESFMAVLTQHMFEPIPAIEDVFPDTDVPPSVRAVVYKAMAKEVEERYPDMDSLRLDLERALTDANYIVQHPGRETTIKYSTAGGVIVGSGRERRREDVATLMDWAPQSGAFASGKKRLVPIAIALVVLLIGAGGAAFLLMDRGADSGTGGAGVQGQGATAGGGEVGAPKVGGASESAAEVDPESDPAETDNGASDDGKIVVAVVTDPAGAVVSVEGMGQVCSSTPCEVALQDGKPIRVEAELDGKTASMTFTPSDQNDELALDLKGKHVPIRKGGGKVIPKGDGKKKGDGKTTSGLKIPDLFKDN